MKRLRWINNPPPVHEIESYRQSFIVPFSMMFGELKRLFGDRVMARLKTVDSIGEKYDRKHRTSLTQIKDIIGFRVIFDNLEDLYRAADILRQKYHSRPEDEEDYIPSPKEGYRGLHLNLTYMGKPVELQLHTKRMNEWSLIGHERFYKEHEGIKEKFGEKATNQMLRYWKDMSRYYALKDVGLSAKKPAEPIVWSFAGLPRFTLNPEPLHYIEFPEKCMIDGGILKVVSVSQIGKKRFSVMYKCQTCGRLYGRIIYEK